MKSTIFMKILAVCCINFIRNTKFDISCVSLARETARRVHMNKILSHAGCNYNIFDAVDGEMVLTGRKKITEYSSNIPMGHLINKHINMGPRFHGTTGLKLSHYIMMKQLQNSGSQKPLLILEDDADIEAEFVATVESTISNMKQDWDIILLTPRYWGDHSRPHNPATKLEGMLFFYGTYGFIVNGARAAKKIADFIDVCPPWLPIDDYYGDLSRSGKLIGYAYTKHIVTHLGNIFQSTIATSFPLGPTKLDISLYHAANANRR